MTVASYSPKLSFFLQRSSPLFFGTSKTPFLQMNKTEVSRRIRQLAGIAVAVDPALAPKALRRHLSVGLLLSYKTSIKL